MHGCFGLVRFVSASFWQAASYVWFALSPHVFRNIRCRPVPSILPAFQFKPLVLRNYPASIEHMDPTSSCLFPQSFPAQKETGISRNCTRKSRTLEGKWALASRSLCSNLSKSRGKVPNAAGTPTKASCLVLHHCPPPEASRIQGFRSHDIIFNHLLNAFLQLELLIVLFTKNKFASQNPRQLQEVSSHPFKIPQVLRLSLPLRPA